MESLYENLFLILLLRYINGKFLEQFLIDSHVSTKSGFIFKKKLTIIRILKTYPLTHLKYYVLSFA